MANPFKPDKRPRNELVSWMLVGLLSFLVPVIWTLNTMPSGCCQGLPAFLNMVVTLGVILLVEIIAAIIAICYRQPVIAVGLLTGFGAIPLLLLVLTTVANVCG